MRLPSKESKHYNQYEISDVSEVIKAVITRFKSPVRFKIVMDGENQFHVELYGTDAEIKKLFSKFAK